MPWPEPGRKLEPDGLRRSRPSASPGAETNEELRALTPLRSQSTQLRTIRRRPAPRITPSRPPITRTLTARPAPRHAGRAGAAHQLLHMLAAAAGGLSPGDRFALGGLAEIRLRIGVVEI